MKALKKEKETYIIKAPNKEFTGIDTAVEFVNGEGETNNPIIADHFLKLGYEVTKS